MDSEQGRGVVMAVVIILGAIAIVGLGGAVWLSDHGKDTTPIVGITGGALGALGALLASTKSAPPAKIEKAKAEGYEEAVADVKSLG